MTTFSLILSILSSALHGLGSDVFHRHSRLDGLPVQRSVEARTHFFEDIIAGETYLNVLKN
jgi:hypothetical protein